MAKVVVLTRDAEKALDRLPNNVKALIRSKLELLATDPRALAKRAESYLQSTGIGDRSFFGPEAEFFVFNDVRYGQGVHYGAYAIDSVEGHWNSNEE